MRKFWMTAAVLSLLAGCGPSPALYDGGGLAMRADLMRPRENQDFSYNHFLSVAMGRDSIKPRFERAQDRCLHDAKLDCTLISASINAADNGEYAGPSAILVVSLPHDRIADFERDLLAPVAGEGAATVRSRSTTAENVSGESADASRKLAQLTDYRDRLAALAKRPGLSVDDLIKVESELSKAQGDLDDAVSQKNSLGERVAKERLSVSLEMRPGVDDAFRPVGRVWRSSVQLFGQSTASALQFLIQVIPWLPLIIGALFLVRWLWRIARRRPAVAMSSPAQTRNGG
jgi:hypothetical protein